MQQLQQPLVSLSGRCKLPITLPQLMGLMQAAQQQGAAAGGLPGGLPAAQTVGIPGAAMPAQRAAASAVTQGAGPPPTGRGHRGLVAWRRAHVAGEAVELQFQTFLRLVKPQGKKVGVNSA